MRRLAIALFAILTLSAGGAVAQSGENVRETHGDWEIRCNEQGRCVMRQGVTNAEGQPVIDVRIAKSTGGEQNVAAVAQIVTPLEVLLPAGLSLQVDGNQGRVAGFQYCTKIGCFVRAPIEDSLVTEMKKGAKAKIALRSIDGQGREFSLSLSGFTKAFGAI